MIVNVGSGGSGGASAQEIKRIENFTLDKHTIQKDSIGYYYYISIPGVTSDWFYIDSSADVFTCWETGNNYIKVYVPSIVTVGPISYFEVGYNPFTSVSFTPSQRVYTDCVLSIDSDVKSYMGAIPSTMARHCCCIINNNTFTTDTTELVVDNTVVTLSSYCRQGYSTTYPNSTITFDGVVVADVAAGEQMLYTFNVDLSKKYNVSIDGVVVSPYSGTFVVSNWIITIVSEDF